MALSVERSCTMLVNNDKPGGGSQIKEALEGKDSAAVATAMKQAVMMILNGEQIPGLFITIVRYVLPSEDHTVQKLGLLYLVCPSLSKSMTGIDAQALKPILMSTACSTAGDH